MKEKEKNSDHLNETINNRKNCYCRSTKDWASFPCYPSPPRLLVSIKQSDAEIGQVLQVVSEQFRFQGGNELRITVI